MTTVVIVDDAAEQLSSIAEWWAANRPEAPHLVLDELERCAQLLTSSPDVGPRFHASSVPGARRLVMRRTKHVIYYLHDPAHAVVYILAIWGAPKSGPPILRAPR